MDLSHHFLVSMPQMQDSCFRNSVVYVLEHGPRGAFGVIVNSAMELDFESLLEQVNVPLSEQTPRDAAVLRGGPVDQSHGLVLHEQGPTFDSTHDFEHGISLSSSKDVLESIAKGDVPDLYLIILGHAGWAPGQLELEVAGNAWLTCHANNELLFDTPLAERRQAVAGLIGVNLSNIVGHAGNA